MHSIKTLNGNIDKSKWQKITFSFLSVPLPRMQELGTPKTINKESLHFKNINFSDINVLKSQRSPLPITADLCQMSLSHVSWVIHYYHALKNNLFSTTTCELELSAGSHYHWRVISLSSFSLVSLLLAVTILLQCQ